MKKFIFLIFLVLPSTYGLYGQNFGFYVQLPETNEVPEVTKLKSGEKLSIKTKNQKETYIYNKYEVYKFEKAFPTAVSPFLKEIYLVVCNDVELLKELKETFPEKYPLVEALIEPQLLYEPNDLGSNGGWTSEEQTNLELIRMPEAWEISKGDPTLTIAITDTDFDLDHPDLDNAFNNIRGTNTYDPVFESHGSQTSSILAAETNNNTGIAGIVIDSRMTGSSYWGSDNEVLVLAQNGARVISCSWINACAFNSVQWALYEQVRYTYNAIVVAGAGNNPDHCGSMIAPVFPASYDNVISVSSVGHTRPRGSAITNGWEDCFESNIGDTTSVDHYNALVNICAPGHRVPVVRHHTDNSYGVSWGTSMATPHVAGVCALMLGVNPCLSPDEVQNIIEETASDLDGLTENAHYVGGMGAGRIDAYEALLEASEQATNYVNNAEYTGTHTILGQYSIEATNTIVEYTANVTFKSRHKVVLGPGFEIVAGAIFQTDVDIENSIPCL